VAALMPLPSVEEARAAMLAWAASLPAETVALADAAGRTLAEDIHAIRDQPPYPASAMDGWALIAADAPGRLAIVGESAAGAPYEARLERGQAVRIFTGAALPPGADAMVIQEDARRDGDAVEVSAAAAGDNIRPAGCDFRKAERLLAAGMRLDPWRLSLAAAGGRGELSVAQRPRVSFLSTGEEIIEPGQAPGPYQIFDSGTAALVVLAREWGAEAKRLRPVGDDVAATVRAVRAEACDLIVTVGGASVGDYDLVKPALRELGLEFAVESVNVRPGKPTWFGKLADGRRVLGLPGNPASALVCAELFLRSVLLEMQGADPALPLILAKAGRAFAANGPREHWMRARLSSGADGFFLAEAFADQDSSLVSVFASADALVRRPGGAPPLAAGALIEALVLGRA
jgi:molybdopterin molybdotransferase